jgi:glycerol-3-phosphate dehydrogenase subunit B
MDRRADVLVVGAGVAGCAAALAARQAGAEVLVLESAAGGTALAGGAWDVAPLPLTGTAAGGSIEQAIRAVARARPLHPYARMDDAVARVRDAHRAVLPRIGGYRALELSGAGALVATDLGLWRRAATVQREVLDFASLGASPGVGVVDLGGYPGWDAEFIAASLAEGLPRELGELRFAAASALVLDADDATRHPHELAALCEDDKWRQRLIDALRAHGRSALLVPPVLGLGGEGVADAMQRSAGVAVGEPVSALAGPQGMRLMRRVRSALAAAGVEVTWAPVVRVHADGGLHVDGRGGESFVAGAVVLATGKHVGGGILVEGGVAREPLAGLPVRTHGAVGPLPSSASGPDPVEQFGSDWWQGGAGFSLGVGYDSDMRALGPRGEPAHPALFVAGALLDGFDPARDGTGLGCCCATGYLAGLGAAAAAGRAHPA